MFFWILCGLRLQIGVKSLLAKASVCLFNIYVCAFAPMGRKTAATGRSRKTG